MSITEVARWDLIVIKIFQTPRHRLWEFLWLISKCGLYQTNMGTWNPRNPSHWCQLPCMTGTWFRPGWLNNWSSRTQQKHFCLLFVIIRIQPLFTKNYFCFKFSTHWPPQAFGWGGAVGITAWKKNPLDLKEGLNTFEYLNSVFGLLLI